IGSGARQRGDREASAVGNGAGIPRQGPVPFALRMVQAISDRCPTSLSTCRFMTNQLAWCLGLVILNHKTTLPVAIPHAKDALEATKTQARRGRLRRAS